MFWRKKKQQGKLTLPVLPLHSLHQIFQTYFFLISSFLGFLILLRDCVKYFWVIKPHMVIMLYRVRSRLPIRSAGSYSRGTFFSTRIGRPIGILQEWLFWRAALSSCVSLRNSLPSHWCGLSQDCERTSLLLRTRPVRRAGSKPYCQPATATWPCLWWTWKRSTEVRD